MAILVTSEYEGDPIKIEGTRLATTQNNDFSNTQGQLRIGYAIIGEILLILLS